MPTTIFGRLLIDPEKTPRFGWVRLDMVGEEAREGRIVEIGEGEPPGGRDEITAGDEHTIICPGFIDAHIHLPQIDAAGFTGLELLDWLDQVIYPAESAWESQDLATAQCKDAYQRMLAAGTLGFAGYLTSHLHSLVAVTRAAHELPIRSIAGQVLMDREAPANLLNQRLARLSRSERGRFQASVNPRFAVACSDAMLTDAANRAADQAPNQKGTGATIQTHLAETKAELSRIAKLFPRDANYTSVYDRHGLLTPRTLLAHCVHLSDEEWRLIAQREAVVVHCPTANTFLNAGVFDMCAARRHDVRLALGSDMAAGPDMSMPRVARAMIELTKVRAMTTASPVRIPEPAEAWKLITRGNAEALGWEDAGHLAVGAAADLLLIRPPFDVDEHLIGRLLYTWRDSYISHRVVNGALM